MIPTLSLKDDIEWDYDNFENNARYAEWEYLDIKKLFISHIIADNGSDVAMYSYTTLFRGCLFHHYFFNTRKLLVEEYDTFTKAISEIKPDGVFEVPYVNGWFLIIDNHIYFLSIKQDKAILTDDALEQIRKVYTDPYYIPITSGSIVK